MEGTSTIVKCIRELLYEHNCVIIPEFGGFIANYSTSRVHPIKNTLSPPSKLVAFNESLKTNDGLLASKLAEVYDTSVDESRTRLKIFVQRIYDYIEENDEFVLEDIGYFEYNEEHKLLFKSEQKINFLEESYSLPEIYFKPIERDESDMKRVPPRPRPVVRRAPAQQKPRPTQPQGSEVAATPTGAEPQPAASRKPVRPEKKKKIKEPREKAPNRKIAFVIIPLILILAGSIGTIFISDQSGTSEASLNPLGGDTTPTEVASNSGDNSKKTGSNDQAITTGDEPSLTDGEDMASSSDEMPVEGSAVEEAAPPVTEEVVETPAPVETPAIDNSSSETIITKNTGRYHIIAGSFRSRKNAREMAQELGGGDDIIILEPKGRSTLMKVSVRSFDSRSRAESAVDQLRGTYGSGIWVYKD